MVNNEIINAFNRREPLLTQIQIEQHRYTNKIDKLNIIASMFVYLNTFWIL